MEERNTASEAHAHAGRAGCFFCCTAKPLFQKMWSDATQDHFRSSRIEFLKGIRSLLDDRIAHLSRHEQKGTNVTVE